MKSVLVYKNLKKSNFKKNLKNLSTIVIDKTFKFVLLFNKNDETNNVSLFCYNLSFKNSSQVFFFTILTRNFKVASLNKYNFHFFLDLKTMNSTFLKFLKSKNKNFNKQKVEDKKILSYVGKSESISLDIKNESNALVFYSNKSTEQQKVFKKDFFFKAYVFFLKNLSKNLRTYRNNFKVFKKFLTKKTDLWAIDFQSVIYQEFDTKIIDSIIKDYNYFHGSDSESETSSDEDVVLVKYKRVLSNLITRITATKVNFAKQTKTNFFFSNMLLPIYILNSDVRYLSLRSRRERTINRYTTDKLLKEGLIKQFGGIPNSVPFFYLSSIKSDIFIKFAKREYQENVCNYLRQYLSGFIENLFNNKLYLKVRSKIEFDLKKKKKITKIVLTSWFWQKILGPTFFLTDAIHIMFISFFFKDLNFLMKWFTKSMTRLKLKKHKKFIKFFKKTLYKNESFFLVANKVKGFKFDIRGKVGVSGNAKKRHTSFYFGNTSFSTKKLRLDYSQGLVYTDTGVLGVTMILSY